MYHTSARVEPDYVFAWQEALPAAILCDWALLQAQLLAQWNQLTAGELEKTRRDRHLIALLIERKYGIHYDMVENYLRNFERTMPLVQ